MIKKVVLIVLLLSVLMTTVIYGAEENNLQIQDNSFIEEILINSDSLELKEEITYQLEVLEERYLTELPFHARKEARNKIDKVINLVDQIIIQEEIKKHKGGKNLSRFQFRKLLQTLRNTQSFAKKRDILVLMSINKQFTVQQVYRILHTIKHRNNKFELLELLVPQISNPQEMYSLFEYVRSLDGEQDGNEDDDRDVDSDKSRIMSDSEFKDFLNTLKETWPYKEREPLIKTVAKSNYFNVEQLLQVLEIIDFNKDRVKVVRKMLPRVVDEKNHYKIISYFNQHARSQIQREVEKIISKAEKE